MCELCDIRKDTDMEFRFAQYQVELRAGRHQEAEKCKARAEELMAEIFSNLELFITMDETDGHDLDLGELLRGKLN